MLINIDKEIFLEYIKWNNLALEQGATLEDYRIALEKQREKKPTKVVADDFWGVHGCCPSCGHYVDTHSIFCSQCGQHLDWSVKADD